MSRFDHWDSWDDFLSPFRSLKGFGILLLTAIDDVFGSKPRRSLLYLLFRFFFNESCFLNSVKSPLSLSFLEINIFKDLRFLNNRIYSSHKALYSDMKIRYWLNYKFGDQILFSRISKFIIKL